MESCFICDFGNSVIFIRVVFLILELFKKIVLTLSADFRSEFRLSQVLGPRWERLCCPLLLFLKGWFNFFLSLSSPALANW